MTNVQPFHLENATIDDIPHVQRLLHSQGSRFIGPPKRKIVDASTFMEFYATHRIMARESPDDEDVIGFAEFKNYPRIYALNVSTWTCWLRHHYCCVAPQENEDAPPITNSNTLFLTHFIYNPAYFPDLFCIMLREVFLRERNLRYILCLERPRLDIKRLEDVPNYEIFTKFGKVFYPKVFKLGECTNTQKLYVIHRDEIISKMRFRRALPEDNDDIVDVIDAEFPELKRDLGSYYIAEELVSPGSHKTMIITEINHFTMGFFWLNGNIDVMKLIRNFELEPYGNLVKVSATEHTRKSMVHVKEINRKHPATLFTQQSISEVMEGRQSLPLQVDIEPEDWSSYASLDTLTDTKTRHLESRINYLNVEAMSDCFRQLGEINEIMKSTDYYFASTAKLMRFYYNVTSPKQSNVFAIQLVGLHSSSDLREVFRFLLASFTCYKDRDYCLFSIPVSWKITPTLTHLLHYFVPVMPRPGCEIDDNVYITHRSCLYGDISVEYLTPADMPSIERLYINPELLKPYTSDTSVQTDKQYEDDTEKMEQADANHIRLLMLDVLNNPKSAFEFLTIRVGNSAKPRDDSVIIGFVILRPFRHLHLIRRHFYVSPTNELLNSVRAEIITLRLNPLFRFESDFIFREIARTSSRWEFYYFAPTKYHRIVEKPFVNDLLTKMQPLEPHRIKKRLLSTGGQAYDEPKEKKPYDFMNAINFETDYYAAYEHRLLPTKHFGSHDAIVIVGFSDMCKAFLRLKIFEWNKNLDFRNTQRYCCVPRLNITVITRPGVAEAELDTHFECDTCENQELCWINWQNGDTFVKDTILRMDLTKYIKFVNGRVRSINREKKVVMMENDCEIVYDQLILAINTMHGLPYCIKDTIRPTNYQHINNRFDKLLMYHKLRLLKNQYFEYIEVKFLIYGKHLLTFEFIKFLITHGVDSSAITLVLPAGTIMEEELFYNNPFHDPKIESILQEMAEDLGIKVYEKCLLISWNLYQNDNAIKSVVFDRSSSGESLLTLECDMFINFNESPLDRRYVEMLQDAGLVTKDNCVEINIGFRTNDPCIFAVGKHTKPKSEINHQYIFVDPMEQAWKLIEAMNMKVVSPDNFDRKYHASSYCAVQLPFDYYMVKIVLPKRYLANHLSNEYSTSMTTYHDYEFCRIRLNVANILEEIVCVTKKLIKLDFLKFFCGKHETLLNNLRYRWYLRCFGSFLDFFQESWTELIQHEHFHDLLVQNKKLIVPKAQVVLLSNMHSDRKTRQEILHKALEEAGIRTEVESSLLQFLRKYRKDFHHPFALPEDFPRAEEFFFT